jgi:hypothetical protein
MEKIVKDTRFFTNTELGYYLPVIQLVSVLEYTRDCLAKIGTGGHPAWNL